MLTRRELGKLAIAAAVAPQALVAELPIRAFLMGDCDYIAARSAAEARAWYREWCGVDEAEVTEVSLQERFSTGEKGDLNAEVLTFAQEIDEHRAAGGDFPVYLATDGHYC